MLNHVITAGYFALASLGHQGVWARLKQWYQRMRNTIRFSCWLKDNSGRVSFAEVEALPTTSAKTHYHVHVKYYRIGDAVEFDHVMTSAEFLQFYRDFA